MTKLLGSVVRYCRNKEEVISSCWPHNGNLECGGILRRIEQCSWNDDISDVSKASSVKATKPRSRPVIIQGLGQKSKANNATKGLHKTK